MTDREKLAAFLDENKDWPCYDGSRRPAGNNADEWALFISEHPGATDFLAVQIAEAIDDAARLMPCGHHHSLGARCVESGTLICEMCDARSARNDAQTIERKQAARIAELEKRQIKVQWEGLNAYAGDFFVGRIHPLAPSKFRAFAINDMQSLAWLYDYDTESEARAAVEAAAIKMMGE